MATETTNLPRPYPSGIFPRVLVKRASYSGFAVVQRGSMASQRRAASPPRYKIVAPGRTSGSSIPSTSQDPYYTSQIRRGSKDDYVIRNSKATSAYSGGVIPLSTETYVNYPPSRSPTTDTYSGKTRRSTLTGSDRPPQALRSQATATARDSQIMRPASPLSKTYDTESSHSKPYTSTSKREHKRVYSIDDRGGSKLISNTDSGNRYAPDDRDRRERRSHHTSSRSKEIVDDDAFSYTDPAGMFNETEPSWRRTERRGSVDRGSSARPRSFIENTDLYGPPPRASTTRFDGPPPSTRGFDKINSGLARNSSLRDPARASSRDRERKSTYDAYGSDDDRDRYYPSRQSRKAPASYRDSQERDLEYVREPKRRDSYLEEPPRSSRRNDERRAPSVDPPRSFKDDEIMSRGFGIRHRSPDKDRHGTSSNESLDPRRPSNAAFLPAGVLPAAAGAALGSHGPGMPDHRDYLATSDPRDERRPSKDDRLRDDRIREPMRQGSRDERDHDLLPAPPRQIDRRPSPDPRQYAPPQPRDDDRRASRDDRARAPPPVMEKERRQSPTRRSFEDDYDRGYQRTPDRDRRDSRRPAMEDDDRHEHGKAGTAAAAAAAIGAGAFGLEERHKHDRRRDEDDDRRQQDPPPSNRRPERDDLRDRQRGPRDDYYNGHPEDPREASRRDTREERQPSPAKESTRELPRDAVRETQNDTAREAPRQTQQEVPREQPKPIDPDEDYRRRIAEAQRELGSRSNRSGTNGDGRSERERRRLRHDDRRVDRDALEIGGASAVAHEAVRDQGEYRPDRRHDRMDEPAQVPQQPYYDPRHLPPPPPGGPPGPRSSNNSLRSDTGMTDRTLTAEPAEMSHSEQRDIPGQYPRDSSGSLTKSAPVDQGIAITDAMAMVPAGHLYRGQNSSDDYSSNSDSHPHERRETRVRIVEPGRENSPVQAPKGILRKPTHKFPDHPNSIREGVAPLKDARVAKVMKERGIPAGAKWTKIDRKLVNPQALEEAKERFEERMDCVIVLRVLTREEIQGLADRTKELREKRESQYEREHGDESHDHSGRRRRRKRRDPANENPKGKNRADGHDDDDDDSETDDTDVEDTEDTNGRSRQPIERDEGRQDALPNDAISGARSRDHDRHRERDRDRASEEQDDARGERRSERRE